MENPSKVDDLGVPPIFGNPQIYNWTDRGMHGMHLLKEKDLQPLSPQKSKVINGLLQKNPAQNYRHLTA